LLEGVKSSYQHKRVKMIIVGIIVTAMIKLQQLVISEPDKFTINAGQLFGNWQHRLRQLSLYSMHIVTSALHHG